jgi:Tfp pilus assembly protein PilF
MPTIPLLINFPQFVSKKTKAKIRVLKKKTGHQVYEQALEVLPDNPELLTNYGSHLFKQATLALSL